MLAQTRRSDSPPIYLYKLRSSGAAVLIAGRSIRSKLGGFREMESSRCMPLKVSSLSSFGTL
jgi:hypothetical protein